MKMNLAYSFLTRASFMPILKIYSWCANSIIIKKYCGALHHCLAIADNEHHIFVTTMIVPK